MQQINYKLKVFEGPMDLLLHLIAKHKLNINDIPIVELVNQYLDYVRQMENADFEIAGDFLEMAARLIYIKTVSLLPRHEEAEQLKKELTGELIEYRDCKIMAKKLSEHTDGFDRFVREPQEGYVNHNYERFHEGEELLNAYISAAGRAQRKLPPPVDSFRQIVARKFVNVASKIGSVMGKLKKHRKVKFLKLFQTLSQRAILWQRFWQCLNLPKLSRSHLRAQWKIPKLNGKRGAD